MTTRVYDDAEERHRMRIVTSLPHPVREDEHAWITVSDGTRLAARIWRPQSSDAEPVPGILEAIPYRKRDLIARRDSIHHPYLAGHGYAGVRLDLRGTGESEGVLTDEYTEQEHRDIEDALAWIAAQSWCTGRTGMMGISLGGCLLSDNLAEAGTMFAYVTCPPDPALVGERWREMWLQRLAAAEPWVIEWLRHQQRDEYWRRASVAEDYAAVQVPVLASSGWADGYSNAVFRVLEHLTVPRKGLIGPWSHKYPHLGEPGPAIGYLQELVRWWDRWLKDVDNDDVDNDGVDNDVPAGPMLYTWMQDSEPPSTSYEKRPGRWVGEPRWPSPNVHRREHVLAPHRIARPGEAVEAEELPIQSPLSVGQFAGKWASYNAPPDLPYDQREEDGGSLVFDTDLLTERCEILGAPVVHLDVAASEPVAMVVARLSDVAPDGSATRVSYGLLNLTHRDSDEFPEPLVPGRRYRVSVPLNGVAQAFPPGHRIRLSLSTSYWPLAWPPPRLVRLTVHTATSSLVLPVRPITPATELAAQPFDQPEGERRVFSRNWDQTIPRVCL